ncbi:MAG TPA: hypothetical protein DDY98_08815, partial [Ruminococcaceae bacterium]|nr:hypothetical protein [Oscillospiraceae bacterium]
MTDTKYELSQNESEFINISKVFFSVLVVFVHVYAESVFFGSREYVLFNPGWLEFIKVAISKIIAGSAVPAFFFFSSLLLYRKEFTWKSNMKKKVKTLLVPYILLNAFWILFDQIPISTTEIHEILNSGPELFSWGIKDWEEAFIGIFSGYPCLYPLWFVRELLLLNVLAILIKKLMDWKPIIVVGLITALYFLVNTKAIIASDSEGVYNHNITALFFWTIGYVFVKYNIRLGSFLKKVNPYAISLVYFVLIILSTAIYGKVFFDFVVSRLCVVAGIVFWLKLSSAVNGEKAKSILLWMSSFSFSIYIFHEKALGYFRTIC